MITLSSLSSLFRQLLDEGHESLSSRRFNQDSLENFFALLRRDRGGFNSNPELTKVLQNLRITATANIIASNGRENCENSNEILFVDPGLSISLFFSCLTQIGTNLYFRIAVAILRWIWSRFVVANFFSRN